MTDEQMRGTPSDEGGRGAGAPATVAHVVDRYHCYPGESIMFFSRVIVHEPTDGLTLSIAVPGEVEIDSYRLSPEMEGPGAYLQVEQDTRYVSWTLGDDLPAGARYQCEIHGTVAPTSQDTWLESRAELVQGDKAILSEETVRFVARAKGDYLRYLPELYGQDELMGRLLMLFESFWSPIQTQARTMEAYLDPRMTTPRLLPWLAMWVGLPLDERLPEERKRLLIREASSLYRRRGTKQALQEYLEIYTGGQVKIVKHRASNLCLGPECRLGPGAALGTGNRPHSFTVTVALPPVDSPTESGRTRLEMERRRLIESVIDAEKPAHTRYTLQIETTVPRERAAGVER